MPAPKGNQFWKARSSHGRKPIWEDPEQLQDACHQYVEWAHENPLEEPIVYQGEVMPVPVKRMRAMTIGGLCIFLGITKETWSQYKNNKEDKGFADVVKEIDEILRTQKFEGASAGMLNPNIIARDLGLKEATSNEHTGKNGGPIETEATNIVGLSELDQDDRDALRAIISKRVSESE